MKSRNQVKTVAASKKSGIAAMSFPTHPRTMNPDPAKQGGLTFLRTELETGMTLVSIAENATDPEKIQRNWNNARKACLSVHHFIGQADLSGDESAELHKKLKELERRLQALESIVSPS